MIQHGIGGCCDPVCCTECVDAVAVVLRRASLHAGCAASHALFAQWMWKGSSRPALAFHPVYAARVLRVRPGALGRLVSALNSRPPPPPHPRRRHKHPRSRTAGAAPTSAGATVQAQEHRAAEPAAAAAEGAPKFSFTRAWWPVHDTASIGELPSNKMLPLS